MLKLESGDIVLERMVRAVEKVKDRLLRATAALEKAGVPYAVVGGNAVAAWVARVDEAAVRNTQFGFVFQFYHLLPELNVLENTLLTPMIGSEWPSSEIWRPTMPGAPPNSRCQNAWLMTTAQPAI